MKIWRAIFFVWASSLACGLAGCREVAGSSSGRGAALPEANAPTASAHASPARPALISARRWAEYHAPVFYQDIAQNRHGGLADLPMRIDFDGDWDGLNNWESLDAAAAGRTAGMDLGAYVYYAVIESETHVFIFYFTYHAQDWEDFVILRKVGLHEHDLEGLMVCVRKDPTGAQPLGVLEVMETQAHQQIYQYVAAPGVGPLLANIDGPVHFTPGLGAHPRVYQQPKGHGIYAAVSRLSGPVYVGLPWTDFPGGDGFAFTYRGLGPQFALDPALGFDPADGRGDEARRRPSYELLSIRDELWPRRAAATSGLFATPWDYFGSRFRLTGLSASFLGDTHKTNASVTPWATYDRNDLSVVRGDWFFDPALTLSRHFSFVGPFALNYVRHPYLGIP